MMKRLMVCLVLALVAAACGGGDGGDSVTSTSVPTTTTITIAVTTVASTTTLPPTTIASPLVATRRFSVPATVDVSVGRGFTKRIDKESAVDFSSNGVSDGYVVLTTSGKNSTDDWLGFLAEGDQLTLSDVSETSVGGLAATFLDVTPTGELNFKALDSRADDYVWEIPPGYVDRIYLLEVEGEFVAILAEAPADRFDDFVGDIELLLASLVWG